MILEARGDFSIDLKELEWLDNRLRNCIVLQADELSLFNTEALLSNNNGSNKGSTFYNKGMTIKHHVR